MDEPRGQVSDDVRKIAEQICKRYPTTFCEFRMDKVLFIRSTGRKSKTKYASVFVVRFPFSMLDNLDQYLYVLEVHGEKWDELPAPQRHMLVFHEMLHIPAGGFDPDSKEYKKTVPHDLMEFTKVVARALRRKTTDVDWLHNDELVDILVPKPAPNDSPV